MVRITSHAITVTYQPWRESSLIGINNYQIIGKYGAHSFVDKLIGFFPTSN